MELPPKPEFLICVSRGFLWRFCVTVAVFVLVWYAGKVLVVAFAGILVAVMLRVLTGAVQGTTRLSSKLSFGIVLLLIGVFAAICVFLLGPRIITQAAEIAQVIPKSILRARDELNQYDWGHYVDTMLFNTAGYIDVGANVSSWASGLVSALSTAVIVLAVGVFAALNPELYERWILRFVPEEPRQKFLSLFNDLEHTLRWWLLGQMVPMVVLGFGTFIGLLLLKIPLAFTLALFTAFMLFIPYVGSVISFIPAALVALMESPTRMLYVVALYLGVHALEGYVLTPLVQRRAVHLPPVVTILSQFFMWTIAGLLGVIVATPLAAAGLTVLNFFYYYGKQAPRDQVGIEK